MKPPKLYILPDAETVALTAKSEFITAANQCFHEIGKFCAMVSGGSTPKRLWKLLAESGEAERELLRRTDWFLADERMVPSTSEESNGGTLARLLLDPIDVPAERRHFPAGDAPDPAAEAARLTAELHREASRGPELLILGMGADGHTASLFPGTAALEDYAGRYTVNEVPQLGVRRYTVTFPVLAMARQVLVLCTGADKAAAVADVLIPERAPDALPMARMRNDNVGWLLDRAAAEEFSRRRNEESERQRKNT